MKTHFYIHSLVVFLLLAGCDSNSPDVLSYEEGATLTEDQRNFLNDLGLSISQQHNYSFTTVPVLTIEGGKRSRQLKLNSNGE